jgi:putative endonuclease
MTDNLCRRVLEHMLKINEGFTKRYNVDKLLYFEKFESSDKAIKREKQIKAGSREKKIILINQMNPDWHNLFHEVCSEYEENEIAK